MQVHLAASFDEAVRIKGEHPDVVPIAGGTDLLVNWPDAHALHERQWLDLSALAELAERGWIRLVLDARRNGRPSERWAVHPHLGDPPA